MAETIRNGFETASWRDLFITPDRINHIYITPREGSLVRKVLRKKRTSSPDIQ